MRRSFRPSNSSTKSSARRRTSPRSRFSSAFLELRFRKLSPPLPASRCAVEYANLGRRHPMVRLQAHQVNGLNDKLGISTVGMPNNGQIGRIFSQEFVYICIPFLSSHDLGMAPSCCANPQQSLLGQVRSDTGGLTCGHHRRTRHANLYRSPCAVWRRAASTNVSKTNRLLNADHTLAFSPYACCGPGRLRSTLSMYGHRLSVDRRQPAA